MRDTTVFVLPGCVHEDFIDAFPSEGERADDYSWYRGIVVVGESETVGDGFIIYHMRLSGSGARVG